MSFEGEIVYINSMPIIPPPGLIHVVTDHVTEIGSKIHKLTGAVHLDTLKNPDNSRTNALKISRAEEQGIKKDLSGFGFKMTVLKQLLEQDLKDPDSLRYKIAEAIEALKTRTPHPSQNNGKLEETLDSHFYLNNQNGSAQEFNTRDGKLLIDKSKLSVVKRTEPRFGENVFELKMQIEGKLNKKPFEHTVSFIISGFNNEIGQGLNLDICDPQESMSRIFRDSTERNS